MSESPDSNPRSAPERGGKSVSGGGDPSYAPTPAEKDIEAAEGYPVAGYQKTPGIGDPGVPGSKTNPVEEGRDPEPAKGSHVKGKVPALKGGLTPTDPPE